MKRLISLAVVITFLLLSQGFPVHAEDVVAPPALIDVTPDLSTGQSIGVGGFGLTFPGLSGVVGETVSSLVRFADKKHNVPEFLRGMGITLDNTAIQLMPNELQEKLSRPYENGKSTVLPLSRAFRLCVPAGEIPYKDQKRDNLPFAGYNKSENENSEFIGAGDPVDPFYYFKALWASLYFGATLARGQLPSVNFQLSGSPLPVPIGGREACYGDVCHKTDIDALDRILAPCGAGASGVQYEPAVTDARGITRSENERQAFPLPVNYLYEKVVSTLGQLEACPKEKPDDPERKECKNAPISITPTDFFAGACSFSSSLIGAGSDLAKFCPLAGIAAKAAMAGSGGALNSFWPAALHPFEQNRAALVPQTQALGESDGSKTETIGAFAGAAGVNVADECVRYGMMWPDTLRTEKGFRCDLTDKFGQPNISGTSLGTMPSGSEINGANGNNPLTYRIPYRNASCQVSQSTIDRAKDIMTRYYPGYQETGTANLNRMWDEVQKAANKAGWNPAFALSLWIEESAAGGAPGAYGMGCIYHTYANGARMSQSGGSDEATREQYQCLFERSFDEDFNRLMCTYSGEQRDDAGHCTNFANNPNFIHNVQWWYDQLSQGMGADCKISTIK